MPIFLFLGPFDRSDEVSLDEDDLLFRSGSRHFLRFEHIDKLYQGTNDFHIQFIDLGVVLDLCEERINVESLHLCLGNGSTQCNHPCLEDFLLLLVGSGHLGKKLIADLAIEVILVEPLDDTVQFGDALCGLFQFPAEFTELPIEVTLVFRGVPYGNIYDIIAV